MIILEKIVKSSRKDKKLMALFIIDGKRKIVHFGQRGYNDYTITNDEKKKDLYLKRHFNRENWNDPTSAGSLSRWLLWNLKTLELSEKDFRRRFHL